MTYAVVSMPIVVDASAIVDTLTGAEPALGAWVEWMTDGRWLLAPPLLPAEVANALVRGRGVGAALAGEQVGAVLESGVDLADRGLDGLLSAIGLAERHGLSVYDATYLWLAIDVDGELATLDRALARAAVVEGVPLTFGDLA